MLLSYSLTNPSPSPAAVAAAAASASDVIEMRRRVWVDLAGGCPAAVYDAVRRTPCGGDTTRDVTLDDGNRGAVRVTLKVAVHDFSWTPLPPPPSSPNAGAGAGARAGAASSVKPAATARSSTTATAARPGLFHPPLAWQRCRRVAALVREERAATVVDIGCGGGALLRALCNNPGDGNIAANNSSPRAGLGGGGGGRGGSGSGGGGRGSGSGRGGVVLRRVIALDTSLGALRETKDWGHRFARFIARNGEGEGEGAGEGEAWSHVGGGGELELVFGSIRRPPPALLTSSPPADSLPSEHSPAGGGGGGGVDVAVLMEVIEHLPKSHLDPVTARVLGNAPGCIRPRVAVFTTPNADYNKQIDRAAAAAAGGGEATEGGGGGGGGGVPRLRHPDHKYELTAKEFKDWALKAGTRYGYWAEIEYIGKVGGGIGGGGVADMMDVGGEDDADAMAGAATTVQRMFVLGATQVAIFRRLEDPLPAAGGTEKPEETLARMARTTEEDEDEEEAAVAGGEKFHWKLTEEVAQRREYMDANGTV